MAPSRALRLPRDVCASCAKQQHYVRPFSSTSRAFDETPSSLPRVAQTTFWTSLLPRSLRSRTTPTSSKPITKPWNPATIFIFLGILVGSNAIQIIALRNEMLNFSRKTDAKLSLLRKVVQRMKDGEDVDVRGLLGTGNPESEGEWEEVMRELEETDMVAEGKRKREEKRREKAKKSEEREAERWADKEQEEGRIRSAEEKDGVGGESQKSARPKFMM